MKKLLIIILCFLMIFSLVACSKDTGVSKKSDGDKIVINFFHRWPNEPRNTFYNEIVKEYEDANPNVKINVDKVLNDPYKEKLRVLVSNEDLPDIFSSWSDSFAEKIVSSGRVKSLNQLLEDDKEWSNNIMEGQIKAFTFNENIYGIPLTIDGKLFVYNTDIFKENNIEVPETFEDFDQVLTDLKVAGYEHPIIEGLTDAWAISHYMGTIFQRLLDPAVMEKDYNAETGEFTDPAYVKGLEVFKTLTDHMGELATAIDHETARNMFINGEVPVIYLQLGEIHYLEEGGIENFDFFDFPVIEGGKGSTTALTGAPEGFMLSDKAPKEAEDFLKFLTSKEIAARFTKGPGQLNAIQGAVTSENASEKHLKAYDVILNASETVPWFDNAVDISIADTFMRGGQSMASGDESIEEVIKKVQIAAEKLRK